MALQCSLNNLAFTRENSILSSLWDFFYDCELWLFTRKIRQNSGPQWISLHTYSCFTVMFSGGHQKLEFEIRCFYRRVFLDQCSSLHDRAFWLTRILKPWPLVYQARLLFLLYGPLLGGICAISCEINSEHLKIKHSQHWACAVLECHCFILWISMVMMCF